MQVGQRCRGGKGVRVKMGTEASQYTDPPLPRKLGIEKYLLFLLFISEWLLEACTV